MNAAIHNLIQGRLLKGNGSLPMRPELRVICNTALERIRVTGETPIYLIFTGSPGVGKSMVLRNVVQQIHEAFHVPVVRLTMMDTEISDAMRHIHQQLSRINGDVFTGNEKAYDTERYISDKVYKKGIFFEVCSFDMFLDEPRPVLSYLMDLLNASSQFQQVGLIAASCKALQCCDVGSEYDLVHVPHMEGFPVEVVQEQYKDMLRTNLTIPPEESPQSAASLPSAWNSLVESVVEDAEVNERLTTLATLGRLLPEPLAVACQWIASTCLVKLLTKDLVLQGLDRQFGHGFTVDYVKGQSLIHIGVLFAMFRATQRCTEATYFDAMLREFKHGFVTALSTEKEKQLGVSNEKLVWGAYLMLLRNGLIRYVDPKAKENKHILPHYQKTTLEATRQDLRQAWKHMSKNIDTQHVSITDSFFLI